MRETSVGVCVGCGLGLTDRDTIRIPDTTARSRPYVSSSVGANGKAMAGKTSCQTKVKASQKQSLFVYSVCSYASRVTVHAVDGGFSLDDKRHVVEEKRPKHVGGFVKLTAPASCASGLGIH